VVLVVKKSPGNAGDIETWVRSLGWARSPGGGRDNPDQYSCLKNPMDRGAWQATVHRLSKSQTWLKQLSTHPRILSYHTLSVLFSLATVWNLTSLFYALNFNKFSHPINVSIQLVQSLSHVLLKIVPISWQQTSTVPTSPNKAQCPRSCLTHHRKLINLDSIVKSRDITLPTKVHLVKAMVFFQWSCMDMRVGLWRKLNTKELMLLNCGVGEYSWESLELQGDSTSPS